MARWQKLSLLVGAFALIFLVVVIMVMAAGSLVAVGERNRAAVRATGTAIYEQASTQVYSGVYATRTAAAK